MATPILLLIITLLINSAVAHAAGHRIKRANTAAGPLPAKTIFQFNTSGTWIENVVARSNGDLLFTTVLPTAQLYLLQDVSGTPRARMIFAPTNVTGLHGITETRPDRFVVFGGNVSSGGQGVPDSFSAWEVVVSDPDPSRTVVGVRHIARIPGARFLNGAAALPNSSIAFASDSALGAVFRLDTISGASGVVEANVDMAPGKTAAPAVGINGIKIREGFLYFDNSNLKTFFRLRISGNGTTARRARTVNVATPGVAPFLDDFAFGPDGNIYAATNIGNTVIEVPQDNSGRADDRGRVDIGSGPRPGPPPPPPGGGPGRTNSTRPDNSAVVVGGLSQLTVAGATAVTFGRGASNSNIMYVVTSGALGSPVNGSVTEPAKVVAIDMGAGRR